MLTSSKYRPCIALASGVIFIISGMLPFNQIIGALDFNVLLMIGGTMGLVQMFIDSHMPERLADMIMNKVPQCPVGCCFPKPVCRYHLRIR